MTPEEQKERKAILEAKMKRMIQTPHFLTGGCLYQDLPNLGMCRLTFVEETPPYNKEQMIQALGVVCDYDTLEFIRDACNDALANRVTITRTPAFKTN